MPGIITIIGASTVTIIATGEKSGGDYVDRIARS